MRHTELFCIDYSQMADSENVVKNISIHLLIDENNQPKIRSIRKIVKHKSIRKLMEISNETYKKLVVKINKIEISINPQFREHKYECCTSFSVGVCYDCFLHEKYTEEL